MPNNTNPNFIPQRGDYRKLRCFQLAEAVYDLTYDFCRRFLVKGDRTIDQMVQAARSGKQNIAEGSAAGSTSRETEIKLTNVAKASLQELLLDFEDYLVTRRLRTWQKGDRALEQTRLVLRENHPRGFYTERAQQWTDETMANVVITMLHQCDYLLERLIESQKRRFLEEGGIREEMTRARLAYRAEHGYGSPRSNQNPQSPQSSPSSPSSQRPPSPPSPQSFPSNPSSPSSPRTPNP